MKWSSLFLALLAVSPLGAEPVLVGRYTGKVVPEQITVFNLAERGVVTNRVPEGKVAAGTVVAILNKKLMEEQREEMELKLARDRIAARDELRTLLQKREDLVFYLSLSERERRYATQPTEVKPGAESLSDLDERIALVRRELGSMEKRARNNFDRQHEPNILRMPFDGRLSYHVTVPADPGEEMEISGLDPLFATACDDSSFYVTLSVTRSDLCMLPGEKFSVRVALPEGREMRGQFARRRLARSNSGTEMMVFYFRLPDEHADLAFSLMGTELNAFIYYEAEGQVERVSKSELAAHPAAADCENWTELVERVYPGAVVVFVADRDVVIRRAPREADAACPPAAAQVPTPAA